MRHGEREVLSLLEVLLFFGIVWTLIEAGFYVLVKCVINRKLQALTAPPEYPFPPKEIMRRVRRAVTWLGTNGGAYDYRSFISGWFRDAAVESIKRGNMTSFLSWAMFAEDWAKLNTKKRQMVVGEVREWERLLDLTFPEGTAEDVRPIRLTLEPVHFVHRPLAVYFFLSVGRCLAHVWMRCLGFRQYEVPACGTRYWVRPARAGQNAPPSQLPLFFFHGIGVGMLIYLRLIRKASEGRLTICLESPAISMTLHHLRKHEPPTEREFVAAVEEICSSFGIERAVFMGHSFGTIPVCWMARHRPALVAQTAFLDPVCLLLFLPRVARNFVYSQDFADTAAVGENLLRIFVAKEKGVLHTLHRHFWWYRNTLWPEELQCPAVVGLAERDDIVPTKDVRAFIEGWALHSPQQAKHAEREKGRQKEKRERERERGREKSKGSSKRGRSNDYGTAASEPAVKAMETVWWPAFSHGQVLVRADALNQFLDRVRKQSDAFVLTEPQQGSAPAAEVPRRPSG